MPDTEEHLNGFIESTRRFCSLFSEWICSLGNFAYLVKHSPIGSNFKLIKENRSHSSLFLNRMETIDISSSDSDSILESDDEPQIVSSSQNLSAASSFRRKLPDSFSRSHTNSTGPQNIKPHSPNRGSTSRGESFSGGYRSHAGPGPSTSYGTGGRDSSSHISWHEFQSSKENGSTFQTKKDDGRNYRSLPSSFQSSGVRNNIHSGDNRGFYHPVELSSTSYGRDRFSRDREDDVHIYDRHEHSRRILPPSLSRGKSVSSAPYASASDPLQNIGFGEERVTGDERVIFQAALQDLSQPKTELDLPPGTLSIPLLRHQKIALAWMVQKESTVHCLGGILADDQGLGKTISTIALIQEQRSLQRKSQSEEKENHSAVALNLDDDDDDDDKGSASLQVVNKTQEMCNAKTETLNLDDDDDNGNASLETVKKTENGGGPKRNSGASSSSQNIKRQRPPAGTLIVCPATVLRQWARELDDKVTEEARLSVLVYHGGNRTKEVTELAKYDVVLTTYSIVSNEVPKQPIVDEDDVDPKLGEKYGLSSDFSINKKRKHPFTTGKKGKKGRKLADSSLYGPSGALARVSWFRVVLDEAQTIKNHRTQTARACCGLRAKRRWCLSGTPIQNSVDELYSYFRFLRHGVYSDYKTFCEAIKIPISRDPNIGYKKLQAVLKTILLRRTKDTLLDGEPIISLPPKFVNMKTVTFTGEERAFYAQLEAESRSQFKAYAAAGTVNQNYANILLMILRLRQACDHPLLVKGFNSDSGRRTNLEKARKLPRHVLTDLLRRLEAPSALCIICSDPAEDAVITICRHVFCYQCVADYLTGDDNMCPARCKEQLSDDILFSEATLRSCLMSDPDGNLLNDDGSRSSTSILSSEYSSSKIKAALEILQSHCKANSSCIDLDDFGESETQNSVRESRAYETESSSSQGPIKTIVFSQWTRMLDLFELSLNQHCIQYRRLDGSMTLVARDRAVREFNTDPEVTVMLMSLKAGNLGLNMVAACHVILLDLWWNPTTEDQAIDRAHRIGQTRPVTVSRITIKDTVEDRILALQEEKRKMVASAFGEDRVGSAATRLTIDDLRYIFLGSRAL